MIVEPLRSEYVREGQFFGPDELYDNGPYAPSEALIFGPTIEVADEVRRQWGGPIVCSSGVRTEAKQESLRAQGYKAASYSPHVIGRSAMDLDAASREEVLELVRLLREVGTDLSIPVRIDYQSYLNSGQTLVHFDTAPLLAEDAHSDGLIPAWVFSAWNEPREW